MTEKTKIEHRICRNHLFKRFYSCAEHLKAAGTGEVFLFLKRNDKCKYIITGNYFIHSCSLFRILFINSCYWSWARCQIFLFLERHTNEAKRSKQRRMSLSSRFLSTSCITYYSENNQEIIKVREWTPHIGPLTKVIPLKLFLEIVPSSFSDHDYSRVAWMFSWRISLCFVSKESKISNYAVGCLLWYLDYKQRRFGSWFVLMHSKL